MKLKHYQIRVATNLEFLVTFRKGNYNDEMPLLKLCNMRCGGGAFVGFASSYADCLLTLSI